MAKKAGRGTTKNIFFKNQEMNFTVLRALMGVYDDGATIGECLRVVQNTKNGDNETFIKEWQLIGNLNLERAIVAKDKGDFTRAKENYFRASTYFKSAMITLNPLDIRHKDFWRLSVDCFEKAGALLECPMEIIQVELNDKALPCYFIPAKKGKVSPVIFLVTGGEGSNMEMYFWLGAYALKNGYSIFLYEGPGNFSTMYSSGITMMPNSEIPIGKALDILCSRTDVDIDHIAMFGISFGGYLVARAAIFDKRIKVLIPNSPLTNIHKMLISVFPNFIFKLPDWMLNIIKKYFMSYSDRATLDLLLWEAGTKTFKDGINILKAYSIEGLESKITCPTLALAGEGEGKEFDNQATDFIKNISSVEKTLRIFTNEEGAGSHCQVDNHRLMNEVVIIWLNKLWKLNGQN
jgi:hypothetical protein